MRYNIRAEFSGNKHEDFVVIGDTLTAAYINAEATIVKKHNLPFGSQFDWRGQVVFVNQGMGVRV